ncbi:crooked neck-like protein 1 [Eurytemora carolleeae]|uniref:crooked neck-like protein 1 n=1 Tax=Eurytemora carolleeae TaxID=1294199 RepID=UPI000C756DC3|nr:crooked neck-like protein 1 [Eurytemora carolleeae]|eukprot:XP_023331526.1 crooked neck-like protein 1 [Eurytemora affinis]
MSAPDAEIEKPLGGATKMGKVPKMAKVKNKAPAELQITAEQLLREAKERELEIVPPPPKQKIQDEEELRDFQMRKRKNFEDAIRKNRSVMSNWIKYATWEESQGSLDRTRSVYERALDVDHRNIGLWLKYTEMEMRNKQVNHARNLWDRAVTILPRANQFWYKYTYMEEMLNNIPGCRAVFERWIEWEPDEQPWLTYIKFELRYKELDRARKIYERFVYVHPDVKNWIRFARFEESHGFINSSRLIYERAVEFFGEENMDEKLFIAFARFEENQKEHDRARVIYKYALDNMSKEHCTELFKNYTIHEKKFGEKSGIENVILSKRKYQYEEEVKENPMNYDAWFDYIRLVESEGKIDLIRETYERAIANIPPSKEKHFWRRYIYLWINYAIFEELEAEDIDRARQVYRAALDLLPHKRFTFSKLWLLYAQFEIRQKDADTARKALGSALGKCPKSKIFRGYIDLEIQLREFGRCRTLYEKFLEFNPENVQTWMKFSELETLLGDVERARALYELAIGQPRLDMPEILWKAYIDFEIEQEETDRARDLYKRLLQRTQHVKVWLSFAQFELQVEHEDRIAEARHVYEEANKKLRQGQEKEERLMLLEAWKEFEKEEGDEKSKKVVDELMPRRVKKRRKIQSDDGIDQGWEEYFDYIFPEDEAAKPNLKLLAMAKMWKKQKETVGTEEEEESENTEVPSEKVGDKSDTEAGENMDADDPSIVNESESEDEEENEDQE